MKLLDKLISFIFALAILVLAVTVILVTTGYVSSDRIYSILHQYVFSAEVKQIALITAIVVALAVLKVTVFNSHFKSKDRSPILVETNHGMIEISQDTIDNTVRSVASEFPEIKEVQAKMIKKKKGIKVYAAISVIANTNIRALTSDLQERIEQVIDETTGIKTLSTNIKVKNIYDKNRRVAKSETTNNARQNTQNENKPAQKKAPVEKVVEEIKEEEKEIKEEIKEETKEVAEEAVEEVVAGDETKE